MKTRLNIVSTCKEGREEAQLFQCFNFFILVLGMIFEIVANQQQFLKSEVISLNDSNSYSILYERLPKKKTILVERIWIFTRIKLHASAELDSTRCKFTQRDKLTDYQKLDYFTEN